MALLSPPAGMEAAYAHAEAVAARRIGCDKLDETTVSEKFVLRQDRSFLEPSQGPVTAVTSLKVNGATVTELGFRHWQIIAPDGFPAGSTVEITYKRGWAAAANLPDPITQSIHLMAEDRFNRPAGVVEQQLGGAVQGVVRFQNPNGARNPIPDQAELLLAPYARPEL